MTNFLGKDLIDGPLVGAWLTSPNLPAITLLARAGYDYVVIDLQHGTVGENDLPPLAAMAGAEGIALLVRARSPHGADIGRPLDLGAAAVVVPSLWGLDEARAAAAATRHAPRGTRSLGEVVGPARGPLGRAEGCVLMIETAGALDVVEDIVGQVEPDGLYVGPADLSASLGCANDLSDPVFRAALERVIAAARAADVAVGVHAADADRALRMRDLGCDLVTCFVDDEAFATSSAAASARLRGGGA